MQSCEKGTVILPLSQMQKLSLREIKVTWLASGRACILTIERFNLRTSELAVKNQELQDRDNKAKGKPKYPLQNVVGLSC